MSEASSGSSWGKRAIGLVLLGSVAALVALLGSRALNMRERARTEVVAALTSASGLAARVGSAELDLSGPSLVARDLELDDAGGHAVLRARTLRVRTTFSSLIGGHVALRALDLSGVTLTLGDDARTLFGASASRRTQWPFDSLALHDADVRIELDATTTLALRAADLRLQAQSGGAMHAQVTAKDGVLERGGARLAQASLRAQASFGATPVLLGSQGEIELAQLHVTDFDLLERAALKFHVERDRIDLAGPLALRAGLGALDVSIGWPREAGSLELRAKPHALHVAALAAQLGWQVPWVDAQLDGEVALQGTLSPAAMKGTLTLDARTLRVGAPRADGSVVWSTPRAGIASRVQLDAAALQLDDLRVELGSSRFGGSMRAAYDGAFTASLLGAAVNLGDIASIAGVALAGHGRLQFDASGTSSAPDLHVAISVDDAALAGVSLGHVAADAQVVQGGARLQLSHVEVASAERHVIADDVRVELSPPGDTAPALRGGASLTVKTTLRVVRLPLSELYRVLGAADDPALSRLQAAAAGSADFSYTRSPRGAALALGLRLDLHEASFDGYRFDNGQLRARIELPDADHGVAGGTLALEQLALGVGGGKLQLAGEMQRGALKMTLGLQKLPLARLPWLAQHAAGVSGRAEGKGELLGSSSDPRLALALELQDLRVAEAEVGRVQVRIRSGAGDCDESKAAAPTPTPTRSPNRIPNPTPTRSPTPTPTPTPTPSLQTGSWSFCGQGLNGHARFALSVGAAPAHVMRGKVEFDRAELDPFLPERPSGKRVHGLLVATLDLTGAALNAPEQMSAALNVQRLELGEGEAALVNHAPFSLRAQHGALSLSAAELQGPKMKFVLSASGSLGQGARVAADGTAAASLWSGLHALVHPFGDVRVHAESELGGRAPARVELEPQEVMVRIGESAAIRKLKGKLVLQGSRVTLHDVSAELGGGALSLGGELTMRGFALERYDLKLGAQAVKLEPQPRFELTVDADGQLRSGDAGALPTLSGVLRVKSLLYARHIEFPAALMGTNQKEREDAAGYNSARDRVTVDLTIEHEEPLRVRNNLLDADVVVGGNDHKVHLVGTDQRLGLLGKLELKRGRLLFHGDEFQLERGDIVFDERARIDPNFDIRAAADARKNPNARIVFVAHGNRDAFGLKVRCDASAAKTPTPFTCDYAHDKLHCDDFDRLVTLWLCQPSAELSRAE